MLTELKGETILVTGATGFIGSHIAERLVALGARVRGLARSTGKGAWLGRRGVEIVAGDLTDAASLRRAVQGRRIVFSIAGWVGQPNSYEAARRVGVDGTRSLIEAAIDAGARRLVHTSSIAVYGPHADGLIDETWPLRATDAYGRTKAQSESVVFACGDRIEVSVIRPAQIFGPRGGAWTTLLFDAVRRGWPILIGGGHGTFHPCYVENLVDAYLLAATRAEAVNQAFTIVDNTTTWREFVGHYARMVGRPARSMPAWPLRLAACLMAAASAVTRRPPIGTPGDIAFLVGSCRYSREKAKRLLDWAPHVSLDEAMRRTETWLRESGRLA
jgi:nucleoside-diphosphate-sugar epimerase